MLAARRGISNCTARNYRNLPQFISKTRHRCATMASETPKVEFTPSLIDVDTDAYDSQLAAKRKLVEEQFAEFKPPKLEVFQSKPKHYRMR
jgi:tRNA/tmRNA/rRNA uracil-C5-methylase (TrmA/RlmC/RlmD family)